jgi:hypothetical protein
VEHERVLERLRELLLRAGDLELDLPLLAELPPASSMEASSLARRSGPVGVLPGVHEIQHRRLGAFDQLEPLRSERGRQPVLCGEAVEIDVVVIELERPCGERLLDLPALARSDEEVGEHRVAVAEEREHAEAAPAENAQRQRAYEASVPVSDEHAQLVPLAVVPPPFRQPGVQQERARATHGADELVPLGA